MSENGISPIEAGLRIERLPFDLQTADELYMIVFSWMSSRNKIEPTSEQIEHVGASFITSFSNAKRHADEMLACFNNNDENLQFKNPKDTSKNLNSRLKISGVKTWCSERELILPEPFPQELAKIIKALFYCHSEEDEYSAWWDIDTAKKDLERKRADINAKKYQYEERKQLDLGSIEQQIVLLKKYLPISRVNHPQRFYTTEEIKKAAKIEATKYYNEHRRWPKRDQVAKCLYDTGLYLKKNNEGQLEIETLLKRMGRKNW